MVITSVKCTKIVYMMVSASAGIARLFRRIEKGENAAWGQKGRFSDRFLLLKVLWDVAIYSPDTTTLEQGAGCGVPHRKRWRRGWLSGFSRRSNLAGGRYRMSKAPRNPTSREAQPETAGFRQYEKRDMYLKYTCESAASWNVVKGVCTEAARFDQEFRTVLEQFFGS